MSDRTAVIEECIAAVLAVWPSLDANHCDKCKEAAWIQKDIAAALSRLPEARPTPGSEHHHYGQPLTAKVEAGKLVIEIGVDVLAHACAYSDWANRWNDKDYVRTFAITDPTQFAKDIVRAMKDEAEDGATPLSDFLDKVTQDAVEDGSEAVEEAQILHGQFSPLETWATAAPASVGAGTPPQEPWRDSLGQEFDPELHMTCDRCELPGMKSAEWQRVGNETLCLTCAAPVPPRGAPTQDSHALLMTAIKRVQSMRDDDATPFSNGRNHGLNVAVSVLSQMAGDVVNARKSAAAPLGATEPQEDAPRQNYIQKVRADTEWLADRAGRAEVGAQAGPETQEDDLHSLRADANGRLVAKPTPQAASVSALDRLRDVHNRIDSYLAEGLTLTVAPEDEWAIRQAIAALSPTPAGPWTREKLELAIDDALDNKSLAECSQSQLVHNVTEAVIAFLAATLPADHGRPTP